MSQNDLKNMSESPNAVAVNNSCTQNSIVFTEVAMSPAPFLLVGRVLSELDGNKTNCWEYPHEEADQESPTSDERVLPLADAYDSGDEYPVE